MPPFIHFQPRLSLSVCLLFFLPACVLKEALVEEDSLSLGWPCRRSGTLLLRAEVDRGGYRQGDVINVTALVTNETSRHVAFTELSLIQRSLFVDIEGKIRLNSFLFSNHSNL